MDKTKIINQAIAAFRSAAFSYSNATLGDEVTWRRLHNAAIDYVSALLTDGANGEDFAEDARAGWLEFTRKNGCAFAGALLELQYCMDCARIAQEDGDILPPACSKHGG